MNKDAIIKTAAIYYSEQDECYITESPLSETISGHGETEKESYQRFLEMVQMNYEAYQKGKHAIYNKPGRPSKNKLQLHAEIKADTKSALQKMAKDLKISQGEAIELAITFYERRHNQESLRGKSTGKE